MNAPSRLASTLDPRGGEALPSKSRMPLVGGLVSLAVCGGGAAAAFLGGESTPAEEPPAAVDTPPAPPAAADPPPGVEPPAAVQPPVGAAPEEAAPVMVTIGSEPPGAEVWRADELLGNTPFDVPRPGDDGRLDLQLRLPGYQSRDFAISSLTDTEVSFALVRQSSRRRRPTRQHAMEEAPMMQQATMRPRRQSEVLDPWANCAPGRLAPRTAPFASALWVRSASPPRVLAGVVPGDYVPPPCRPTPNARARASDEHAPRRACSRRC